MHDPAVKHTIVIFERIYNQIPPLVSQEDLDEIKTYLESVQEEYSIELHELEEKMFFLIQKVWPHIQAMEDIYKIYEKELADKLLEQKASINLRKKYNVFKKMGGSFYDLYKGAVDGVFNNEEHLELAELLVELKKDIRNHALQAIMTHDKKLYDEKVEKYGKMIEEVNNVVEDLHSFANEEESEDFAQDIRDRAKAIKHSLTFLGPKMSIEEILSSREYYEGKKEEIKMRR